MRFILEQAIEHIKSTPKGMILNMKFYKMLFLSAFVSIQLYGGVVEDGIKAANSGDEKKAIALFQQACKEQQAFGCYDLAVTLKDKEQKRNYFTKAKKLFEKGCQANRVMECNALGIMYGRMVGVALDINRSIAYFKKACDGGAGYGCVNAGAMLEQLYDYAQKGYNLSTQYYKKACEMKVGEGCYYLGINYDKGRGVIQNKQKAKKFFDLACKLNYKPGCKK